MNYDNFKTFNVEIKNAIAWTTFDYPPVNIQGLPMIADLNMLAQKLETDRNIKVVVFQSAHPDIFVAHADTNFLKEMSSTAVSRNDVKLLDLQITLDRISKLPQATIAKIEGFARGGGHEFALACDMRFATRSKAKFMQMEVAMGILPCGGGSSRMARQVGLGRALEMILSAQDYDADQAEAYGTINKALNSEEIGPFVEALANRIALWPAESINACKQAVYASIDKPIEDALKEEAYWLYQATSQTPALKRFQWADDNGAQFDMNNQRNWENALVGIQDI
ncbi:MAG: enoyl-CoA hydratase/isomerase family protein [Cyanobacteria bacterium P01_C01_bin.73]